MKLGTDLLTAHMIIQRGLLLEQEARRKFEMVENGK